VNRSARTADQALRDEEANALFFGLENSRGLILAVSGGPDSTALLLIAARWAKRIKRAPKLVAVTIDHGLRAEAAREALRNKDVDLLFGDGVALAFWLNGSDSAGCCVFRGGPYLESRYFGEGVGIAVKRGNDLLRQALNWALFRDWEKGGFTDLWLRYFPISPF